MTDCIVVCDAIPVLVSEVVVVVVVAAVGIFTGEDKKPKKVGSLKSIEQINGELEKPSDEVVQYKRDKKILDESNIQIIGNQLFSLIDDDHRQKVILDFSNVEYLSSAALGKLIQLDKKVKAAKAQLRLCSIRKDILEVFKITKLNIVFKIFDGRDQALMGF